MKERLVGAAVLVSLGVWLIPWVLDGSEREGQSAPPALELPVPATDSHEQSAPVQRSQTIELGTARVSPPTPAAGQAGDVADRPERLATSAPAEVPATSAAAQTTAQTEASERSATTAQTNDEAQPAPRADSQPASTPPERAAGWLVQLGAFGNKDNARRQVERVQSFEHRVAISEFVESGRVLYRVRVGPLDSRGEAEATASALSAHGFVAKVVNPD